MDIYFASGNEHKKEEMERLLGLKLSLPTDFNPTEDGSSFIENALIKARYLFERTGKPCLADDSGLCVAALNGRPGINTARYGCEERKLTSKEQYTLLLKELEGKEDRRATFVCALVLMLSKAQIYIVQEVVNGTIAKAPSGEHGFGYDPVFIVEDTGKTAAELSADEKDLYSHRGRAARRLSFLLGDLA